jgi:hypothetical protein
MTEIDKQRGQVELNTRLMDSVDDMGPKYRIKVEGYEVSDSIFIDRDDDGPADEYIPVTVDADLADVVAVSMEKMNKPGLAFGLDIKMDTPGADGGETRTYLVRRQASRENIDDYYTFMLLPESIASYESSVASGITRLEALRQVENEISVERVNQGMQIFSTENPNFYTERMILRAKQD